VSRHSGAVVVVLVCCGAVVVPQQQGYADRSSCRLVALRSAVARRRVSPPSFEVPAKKREKSITPFPRD
jgi:hypothetical protein